MEYLRIFEFEGACSECGFHTDRGTHQSAPEAPRVPFCTEILRSAAQSLPRRPGWVWPVSGVMGFLFGASSCGQTTEHVLKRTLQQENHQDVAKSELA